MCVLHGRSRPFFLIGRLPSPLDASAEDGRRKLFSNAIANSSLIGLMIERERERLFFFALILESLRELLLSGEMMVATTALLGSVLH